MGFFNFIEQQDRMIFDLDPGEGLAGAMLLEAAGLIHTLLDELGLQSCLKTTCGPRNRIGKVYVDYLRNGRGATSVVAFSARARAAGVRRRSLGGLFKDELDSGHGNQ